MSDPMLDVDLTPDGPVVTETWLGAPALSYPRRPATVLHVLDRAVRRWPGHPAFVGPDGAVHSYAEFGDMVAAVADRLGTLGVRPGDRVAVASGNSVETAAVLFACAATRAVAVGLNIRLAPPQWAYMISHSRAVLVLGRPDLLPALRAAAGPVRVEPLDPPDPPQPLGGRLGRWRLPDPLPAQEETYQVVWTSGTTGRPKGSQVVHRCSVHSAMSYQKVLGLRPGETTAVLFPLYYISAMHAHVLPAMLAGATCVLVDTASPRRWLDLLAEHRVAWAYAVPSWWQLAVRSPELSRERLPALRVAAAGGAPFPASLVTVLRERLPGVRLLDVYGLSETHSPATMLLDEEFDTHPGSVGRPLPCTEVAIRDPASRRTCGVGEVGEVELRGSLVTTGYLDDPAATDAAVTDGWFRTGDLGRLDAAGHLTIVDRVKDMINRGGHKVFSAEVEALLRTMPGVADVAVVAAPDRVAGEAVVAFVVASPGPAGATVDGAGVRRWVRERMAEHAAPSRVELIGELPRNPTGKTDKPALRALLG